MLHPKQLIYVAFTIVMMPNTIAIAEEVNTCKCAVTGEKVVVAKAEALSKYKKATVYFCCNDCKKKFDADPKKYSTKANLQLVATKQAKQVSCPFSGGKLDADQTIAIDGMKVSFCCAKCRSKAAAAKGEKQLAMLFGDKAFATGFKVINKSESR